MQKIIAAAIMIAALAVAGTAGAAEWTIELGGKISAPGPAAVQPGDVLHGLGTQDYRIETTEYGTAAHPLIPLDGPEIWGVTTIAGIEGGGGTAGSVLALIEPSVGWYMAVPVSEVSPEEDGIIRETIMNSETTITFGWDAWWGDPGLLSWLQANPMEPYYFGRRIFNDEGIDLFPGRKFFWIDGAGIIYEIPDIMASPAGTMISESIPQGWAGDYSYVKLYGETWAGLYCTLTPIDEDPTEAPPASPCAGATTDLERGTCQGRETMTSEGRTGIIVGLEVY